MVHGDKLVEGFEGFSKQHEGQVNVLGLKLCPIRISKVVVWALVGVTAAATIVVVL